MLSFKCTSSLEIFKTPRGCDALVSKGSDRRCDDCNVLRDIVDMVDCGGSRLPLYLREMNGNWLGGKD